MANSYFEHLERIASSLEEVAAGHLERFRGRTFDFATDEGVRAALAEVVRAMGGEVVND